MEEVGAHADIRRALYIAAEDDDGAATRASSRHAMVLPDVVPDSVAMAVSERVMKKVTGLETVPATMIAAEIDLPRPVVYREWETGTLRRLLTVERCQDPGNLGTLLRSAVSFGWDGVYLLPGCADPFNDKCIRASRGACFRIPIGYGSIEEWKEICNHHSLVRLAADAGSHDGGDECNRSTGTGQLQQQQHYHYDSTGDSINAAPIDTSYNERYDGFQKYCISLAVGSEGQGLSPVLKCICTPVSIPMLGDMESLNVAAAAAICMCVLSPAGPLLLEHMQEKIRMTEA